jgi:tripartite-type tricarboxylate transporter receptor subunit TctC
MMVAAAAILPQIEAGQARALAVTANHRLPQAPEVPTLAEAGLPNAESYAFIGLIAPAGMPADRVARLAQEAKRGLEQPATREVMEKAGFEVVGSSPEDFARFLEAERERWGGLIRRLGITGEG